MNYAVRALIKSLVNDVREDWDDFDYQKDDEANTKRRAIFDDEIICDARQLIRFLDKNDSKLVIHDGTADYKKLNKN